MREEQEKKVGELMSLMQKNYQDILLKPNNNKDIMKIVFLLQGIKFTLILVCMNVQDETKNKRIKKALSERIDTLYCKKALMALRALSLVKMKL